MPPTVPVDFLVDLPHAFERVFEGGNDPAKVMEIGGLQFSSPTIFEPFLAHLVGAHAKLPDLPGHWANRQVAVHVDAVLGPLREPGTHARGRPRSLERCLPRRIAAQQMAVDESGTQP